MCSILHIHIGSKHLKARSTEGLSPHPVMQRRFHHLYIYIYNLLTLSYMMQYQHIIYLFLLQKLWTHQKMSILTRKLTNQCPAIFPWYSMITYPWFRFHGFLGVRDATRTFHPRAARTRTKSIGGTTIAILGARWPVKNSRSWNPTEKEKNKRDIYF